MRGDATRVCTRMLPLASLSTKHSQVCICMLSLAPLSALLSKIMHMHAPSRTPVSYAQPCVQPTCSLSHPCQLRSARFAYACSLSHIYQLRTARYARACSLLHPCQLCAYHVCFFSFPLARLSAQLIHVCTHNLLIAHLSAPRMPGVPPQSWQYVNYRQIICGTMRTRQQPAQRQRRIGKEGNYDTCGKCGLREGLLMCDMQHCALYRVIQSFHLESIGLTEIPEGQ